MDRPIDYVIAAHDVTKTFGNEIAVDHLNLSIPPGIIFGMIGPSGCGKTTTVRLLLGIYRPEEGDINVLGSSPQKFSRQTRTQIGYMPQMFVIYPELSVWENLNFAASLYGVSLWRKQHLQELLDLVELTGHEHKKARDLSGGMQRRLSLAASLIHKPTLLFLDEPTGGIDPVLRRKFWDYFQLLKENEHTLFVTTQYVAEAAYCDYVGVMKEGRLLMVETPDTLRRIGMGGDILRLLTTDFLNQGILMALKEQPFVLNGQVRRLPNEGIELIVDNADAALPKLLDWCQRQDLSVKSANNYVPPFDDVFVNLFENEGWDD
jgi:ABC-2 type transport system ATP-binding protein